MKFAIDQTPEQELIILTSRLTFNEDQKKRICVLLGEKNINWFEFYKLSLYHKTMTLCWENMLRLYPDVYASVPKYLRDIIISAGISIAERNEYFQLEIEKLLEEFKNYDITCIPVKGAYLIPNMYKDYSIRYSGDADFLIKHSDIEKIERSMKNLGFVKGKYSQKEKSIIPISRAEEIKWKMTMTNLPLFVKLNDSLFTPVYMFDFRFALDDSLNQEPINEIIDDYIKTGYVNKAHFLTHLCTHFYGEATYSLTIFLSKDMSLIKLCDIREYILQFMDSDSLEACVCFAKKYNLTRQIYYSMFFLKLVYNDGYEENVLRNLSISDDSFLNEFGENQLSERRTFKKGFYERLFSCGNRDEMSAGPGFLEIK